MSISGLKDTDIKQIKNTIKLWTGFIKKGSKNDTNTYIHIFEISDLLRHFLVEFGMQLFYTIWVR